MATIIRRHPRKLVAGIALVGMFRILRYLKRLFLTHHDRRCGIRVRLFGVHIPLFFDPDLES